MNWPLGTGFEFRGVYDRMAQQIHLFELVAGGAFRAPVQISSLADPVVRERFADSAHARLLEEIDMLDIAGSSFDADEVLSGAITPVFFGSARNNFGVQALLDSFLQYAEPPPAPPERRNRDTGRRGGIFRLYFQDSGKHGPPA